MKLTLIARIIRSFLFFSMRLLSSFSGLLRNAYKDHLSSQRKLGSSLAILDPSFRWDDSWESIQAFFLLSLILVSTSYAECEIKDDKNQILHLMKPARRIISLAPDSTEILFAIGAGKEVVGVIHGSDYPPLAKKILEVGSYTGLDLERIISLHPDLIVTWENLFSRQLAILKKMGIPVYVSDMHRLKDIPKTMMNFGCLTDHLSFSQQVAKKYLQRLTELKNKFQHQKPVTIFYQIGSYSLITINKHSWINQAMNFCGGRNIFANAKFSAPEVSWEAVVSANPEVIITDALDKNWKERWLKWQMITAVKNKHLYAIPPDIIDRASPRLLDGVEKMCEYLQEARV